MAQLTIKRIKPIIVRDDDDNIIGYLRFDPSDPAVLARFKGLTDRLGKMIDEHEAQVESEAERNEAEEILRLDKICRDEIDRALGCDASSVLFAELGPLSRLEDGSYNVCYVIEALVSLIGEAAEAAEAASSERIHNKIDKYAEAFNAEAEAAEGANNG